MIHNRRAPLFAAVILAAVILTSGTTSAQKESVNINDPAELVPSSAIFYAHTVPVEKTIGTVNFIINKYFYGKAPKKAREWREDFQSKTGIDPLDAASLSKAGIDVSRPAALAFLGGEKDKNDKEKILILIPVKDGKKFPLMFADILRKYNKDNKDKQEKDYRPVITRYSGHDVYRILKDLYFCSIGGYLVLAPTGELIHVIIDMHKVKTAATLLSDPLFDDYLKKKKGNDIGVFLKRDFISEISRRKTSKNERQNQGKENDKISPDGPRDNPDDKDSGLYKKEKGPGSGMRERKIPGIATTEMKLVEYIALGLRREARGITLEVAMSLDPENVSTRVMEKLFKTGLPDKLIVMEKPLAYYYVALDLKAVEALCGSGDKALEKTCRDFNTQIDKMSKSTGIDFRTDMMPYFGGFFNMVMKKSRVSRTMDNFVLLIPMNDMTAAKKLWKKLRKAAQKNNKEDNHFGDEKIDNIPSFWYKDKKNNKMSVLAFEKGIYVANNVEFLRSVMTDDTKLLKDTGVECIVNVDPGTFLLSYVHFEDDSYLKTVLMLLTYKTSPELSKFFNRLEDMSLVGRRDGTFYSFCITLNLVSGDSDE